MKHLYIGILILFGLLISTTTYAQLEGIWVKGQLVEIETKDGLYLIGTIQERGPEYMLIKSESIGEFTLDTKYIKNIKEIKKESFQQNEYWHENTNYSRNYYGPTGMGLKKGHGYYQNLELVWNHFAYAFTDYFTLGVDFEIVTPLLLLSGEQVFDYPIPVMGLTPKFSFPISEKIYLGAGAMMLLVPDTDRLLDLTLPYLVGTYGDKDKNFTLGFGYPFIEDEDMGPIFTISGQYRVNKSISLVTENWIGTLPEEDGSAFIGVYGVRYLARKLTWDFGIPIVVAFGDFQFIPVPLIGIAFAFDRSSNN